MLDILRARWQQGHRTTAWPDGPAPELPARFAGRPEVDAAKCAAAACTDCVSACPVGAIARDGQGPGAQLDLGRCIFCRACEEHCTSGAIRFTRQYRMAATRREDLIVPEKVSGTLSRNGPSGASQKRFLTPFPAAAASEKIRRLFGHSLKLRQVSAGGCNACETDTNVLGTVGWDLGRFGIQFVASPRHADGLLITGPVPQNMRLALEKTYQAVPTPKIVIAVGACAINGGPFVDHPEVCNGASGVVPVDLFVPGCPPHPLTILDALLAYLGRIE